MELSKNQIKRIDSFLEGIGVEYIDIRLEMVDHIATEIEEKVSDVDEFFDNQGFQTPFVKYMLSRKAQLFKNYQKQVKRSFWSNLKRITIDIFKELMNPISTVVVMLFLIAIFFLEKFNLEYVTKTVFVIFTLCYFYMAILFHRLKKKFGNIRLIQAYSSVLVGVYIIAMYFPISTIPFIDENYTTFGLYKLVTMVCLNFLVYKSYMSRKDTITNYYKTIL